MGRGRAKAKQTKVARELKYHSPNTDLTALQRELAGSRGSEPVDDEYAERIFVIFQRLHTRDAYEGTGIGLAMCRKIIEYHGGRISLAPAAPDRGAQFTFTLPAGDPEEEPAS